MIESKTITGRWWVEGLEQPAISGTLNTLPDELSLSIWKHQSIKLEELLSRASKNALLDVPPVIWGRDEDDKPVSLFGCSVGEYSSSAALEKFEINALAAVRGLEIESWTIPVARAVLVKPALLHQWFDRKLLTSSKSDDGKVAFAPEDRLDLVFPLEAGISIRFSEFTLPSRSSEEYRFFPDSQVWFHFEEPRSLADVRDRWVPWLTRLLGLLIGTAVWSEEIRVFTVNPYEGGSSTIGNEGELLPKSSGRGRTRLRKPHAHNMVAPFEAVKNRLGEVLAEWHRVCTQLEPVVDLFAAVALYHELFLEARFLFLVQALEIYHACSARFESRELPKQQHKEWVSRSVEALPTELRDWAKGKLLLNSRSLCVKLLEIFKAHQSEAKRVFDDVENAASRIAYTRNY